MFRETPPIAHRKQKRTHIPGQFDRTPYVKQPPTTPKRPKSSKPESEADVGDVCQIYKSKRPMPSSVFGEHVPETFWLILYDDHNRGWLYDIYIGLWIKNMLTGQTRNAKWLMFTPEFHLVCATTAILEDSAHFLDGTNPLFPPLWNVQRLFFPINVPRLHWLMADLDLSTWKITLYDSMNPDNHKVYVDRIFTEFTNTLGQLLNRIRYWEHANLEQPERLRLGRNYARNVPQQKGLLSDCGVWVCVLMYVLSKTNSM